MLLWNALEEMTTSGRLGMKEFSFARDTRPGKSQEATLSLS